MLINLQRSRIKTESFIGINTLHVLKTYSDFSEQLSTLL